MKPKRVFTDEQKIALQNALCKCSLIRYLARDKNGILWGYSHKPKRAHDSWACSGNGSTYIFLGSLSREFPQITWKDEKPTSCEEILCDTRLVEEMAQAMSDFELEDTAYCDIELSRHLIAKGYRKQSDTAKEILRMLKDKGLFRYESYLLHDSDFNTVAKLYGVNPEEV